MGHPLPVLRARPQRRGNDGSQCTGLRPLGSQGRHFGVPVYVLLGGPTRTSIPAYASALGYSLELDAVRAAGT